jgi:hypothetical protein
MTTSEEITVLVKATFTNTPRIFSPCAFFDDRLDCIRVVAKDCSVMETRINEHLTVLEDNYAESDSTPYVGFTIKGARHFCNENGLSLNAPIQVSALLDAVLKSFPEMFVEMFVNGIARPLVKDKKIKQVEVWSVSEPLLQPA